MTLSFSSWVSRVPSLRLGVFALGFLQVFFAGCATPSSLLPDETAPQPQVLNAGDQIAVRYLDQERFDIEQTIRIDGKINLKVGGEIVAAGKTPADLEKEIQQLAVQNQTTVREVKVIVVASSFAVNVTGAVMKPGKITPTHALTALEAVMEAGGFDPAKADTKNVVVLRYLPDGTLKRYVLNLQDLIDGKSKQSLYLRHNDTVMVNEKFVWF